MPESSPGNIVNSNEINADSRRATSVPYNDEFYLRQRDGSYQSADCVVPLVLSLIPARSVVDVGCGVGTWAAKFLEYRVGEVLGVDGDYVNRDLLKLPKDCFLARDLSKPLEVGRRFDLAVCLEVGEHLPRSRSEGLVEDLVKLAPVVLFSAAIPGQGGDDHINEQYLSFWVKLFSLKGYVLLDVIRPAIWNNERCEWWYRQNVVLFADKNDKNSSLRVASGIDCVHPECYEQTYQKWAKPTLGYLVKSLPGSLVRSLRVRWQRLYAR